MVTLVGLRDREGDETFVYFAVAHGGASEFFELSKDFFDQVHLGRIGSP